MIIDQREAAHLHLQSILTECTRKLKAAYSYAEQVKDDELSTEVAVGLYAVLRAQQRLNRLETPETVEGTQVS